MIPADKLATLQSVQAGLSVILLIGLAFLVARYFYVLIRHLFFPRPTTGTAKRSK